MADGDHRPMLANLSLCRMEMEPSPMKGKEGDDTPIPLQAEVREPQQQYIGTRLTSVHQHGMGVVESRCTFPGVSWHVSLYFKTK